MNKHLFGGVVAVGLAFILFCTFTLSLGVLSFYVKAASDNTFDFTGATQTFSIAGQPTYEMTDRRDYSPPADGNVRVNQETYWSTDQYPAGSYCDTSATSTWTVYIEWTGGGIAGQIPFGIEINALILDSAFSEVNKAVGTSLLTISAATGSATITMDAWGTQESTFDLSGRYLALKFIGAAGNKRFNLEYGETHSRFNTGYVIPENLLGFLFAAPLIPLVGKAVARWSERIRRSAGREEKGGRQ